MGADLAVARRFGTNLRQARKRADLSQEEVGARASLHRTEIGLLERGARVPRIDTLIKIAFGLGVRIDCALLDGITWTPGTTHAGGFKIGARGEDVELRARSSKPADLVTLVQEARDELEQRGLPEEPEEG
jgi:transcriptional regulator with XRE-family HTH domain